MSRVAKKPITLPKGVQLTVADAQVTVKGAKGTLSLAIDPAINVVVEGETVKVEPRVPSADSWMRAGTTRANLNNLMLGVSKGFEKKLELVGVGYRAQAQGRNLNLTLGYSHPVAYALPEGITAETPSQTEILIKGLDKQLVGLVAAKIRGFRPPEPYKGKGVRYAAERVRQKEAKKK
ncbi:MAG: 50S ribosomal protein L6 [Pseudomonadota bacterium]